MRFDESLGVDTRLPEDAAQRPSLDLTMQRHDTADRPASQHHVTPSLTNDDEPEMLEHPNGLRSRDVREFRQRRRCGRW